MKKEKKKEKRKNGKKIFVGRNRDQFASRMYLINLSLGGYEYKFIKNDYLDNLEYKNVIHYKIDFNYNDNNIQENYNYLANSMAEYQINNDTISSLVNKVCLSNFVGEKFLKNLDTLFKLGPDDLKRGYSSMAPMSNEKKTFYPSPLATLNRLTISLLTPYGANIKKCLNFLNQIKFFQLHLEHLGMY